MATKRKTYKFKQGRIVEIEEFHDGNYGAPGMNRRKKKKPTKEEMEKVNAWNKTKRCRRKLLEYFNAGDTIATWTYEKQNRPPDMKVALKDFQKAIRKVREEYKKRGYELRWIRNIEKGTKGAWHIHIIVNEIGDSPTILKKAWEKGGTWTEEIRNSEKIYDEGFEKLAAYMTKSETTREKRKDGEISRQRIKEANYSTSRNMPIPEPKEERLVRWKKEIKPKKGYYIAQCYEGINPVTGFKYRRCTLIRIYSGERNKEKGKARQWKKKRRKARRRGGSSPEKASRNCVIAHRERESCQT